MSQAIRRALSAAGAGLLFGAGLVVSGMTNPNKVIGFLDVFGDWDASLLFVMAGAIAVHAPAYRLITRRSTPLFAPTFSIPTRREIDAKLVLGAGLFGIGWGLSGYCPGPSLVSLAALSRGAITFVAAFACGTFFAARLERLSSVHPQPTAAE